MYSATLYFTDGVAQESTNYAHPPAKFSPQLKKCTVHKLRMDFTFFMVGGKNENSMTHGNHIRFKFSVSINEVYFWNMATLI